MFERITGVANETYGVTDKIPVHFYTSHNITDSKVS